MARSSCGTRPPVYNGTLTCARVRKLSGMSGNSVRVPTPGSVSDSSGTLDCRVYPPLRSTCGPRCAATPRCASSAARASSVSCPSRADAACAFATASASVSVTGVGSAANVAEMDTVQTATIDARIMVYHSRRVHPALRAGRAR